jgi:hypothetical protein
LKKKFEPVSAALLVKMEKRSVSVLSKRIKTLRLGYFKDLYIKIKDLKSRITENQVMIHTLNNMRSEYDLQIAIMEKRINNKVDPLTIDEIREDLSLGFERLNMKANEEIESEVAEDLALFGDQLR